MSKKRKTKLIKGKFYASYPNGGHPSLIFKKNKRKNRYDAIVFGTTLGHHRKELSHPIARNIKLSVVHTRPIRGVRLDFGDKKLLGLRICKEDKIIIEFIKRKYPLLTSKYKNSRETKKASSHKEPIRRCTNIKTNAKKNINSDDK